jgi:hypothetical protein
MIARIREHDGKAEFLMDALELQIFESMVAYFAFMVPNRVYSHVAHEMMNAMGGGTMLMRLGFKNRQVILEAKKQLEYLEAKFKKMDERPRRWKEEAKPEEPKGPVNSDMADKLKAALGGNNER